MKAKIAALALLTGSAFFSNNVFASTIPEGWVAGPQHIIGCTNGNFRGQIKFNILKRSTIPYNLLYVSDYKIDKNNGQQGGNKANINVATYTDGTMLAETKSPDDMKQVGSWLGMRGGYRTTGLYPNRSGAGIREVKVQFIFDKSGMDPKCVASYHVGASDLR